MRARISILLALVPVLAWMFYGLFANTVATRVAARFGAKILAGGDGKIMDPQHFVKMRMMDAAILATAACLAILAYRLISRVAAHFFRTPSRWIIQGWSAFLCFNGFVAVAGHTALWWCALFNGKDHTDNYTQWQIKAGLMKEINAPSQAVLIGASQTQRQIDTKVLNARLAGKIWTTELHFPGSDPYQLTLCLEHVPATHVDYIITYVSDAVLYSANNPGMLTYFFGFRDLPGYWALGGGGPDYSHNIVSGLLGDAFPIYRIWPPIYSRLRGWEAASENQKKYNQSLANDLTERAQAIAKVMNFAPTADYNKREFATLAKMCRDRHSRLVICSGQVNPILEHALNPALRADTMAYLRELARNDTNVILLEDSQFPPQDAGVYEDLLHVNKEARARFSEALADAMAKFPDLKSR